jgi:dTMP kinase
VDLGGHPEGRHELDHHAGLTSVPSASGDLPVRGRLLVLEGPEGVGKTTQAAALTRWLVGALPAGADAVRAYREPGGTALGEAVRGLVLDPAQGEPPVARAEALLFMAARAQLMARVRDDLARGATVLLDRFFLSTYAYQVVGRGLPLEAVRQANQLAVAGLVPDLTLLLLGDPDTLAARVRARGSLDRMEQAGDDFHARVGAAFDAAADPGWQAAHPEVGPVARIAAHGTPEEVTARIVAALAERWRETFRPVPESH